MKAIVFGGTGMVGQGVVHTCLADPNVQTVLLVSRTPSGVEHPKLREIVRADLFDYSGLDPELQGYDACFFCLGVSSVGMKEDAYRKVTHDLTLAAAHALLKLNPGMTFVFVSGAGTDSTARGRSMWARVKGQTENDLLGLGFKAAFMFRPGYIQPMKGIRSKTFAYRAIYAAAAPLFPVWSALFPGFVTTSERIGRAMIRVAKDGYGKPILESADINQLGT